MKKKFKMEKNFHVTPFVESSQPGVGEGLTNAAGPSACPFGGCRTARCLLHTPPHLCRELEGLSLAGRSHTCLRVCASNGCTQVGLQFFLPTFPPFVCPPLSFPPPPAHLCVVFLPLFLLPSLFSTSPLCSVLRAQTVAGV